MLERVKKILSKYTEVSNITEETILTSDLGLLSFDVVVVVLNFEDKFDIEIPDRDIRKLVTVGDVITYLDNIILCLFIKVYSFAWSFKTVKLDF